MAKQTMKFKATQFAVRVNYSINNSDNYYNNSYEKGETFGSIEEFNQSVKIRQERMNQFEGFTVSYDILNNEGTSIWQGRAKVTDKTPYCLISRMKAYRESLAKMEYVKHRLAAIDEIISMLEEAPEATEEAPEATEEAQEAPEETPVADTEPTPADDDDDYEPMFSYMRGELNDMEAQADKPTPADDDNDDDYSDENHGNLAIELPQEYAVFNLHGGYEELANTMHNRLDMRFNLTTDLFGDSDEPVTIADIDDILDEDAYDGWRVFVDGWWDNELRLYAQRDGADSEDATPSLHSDWVMIDADHGYLTIGTPV